METKKRLYLSPPHMSGNEQKYINEAFETNWIAPLGPQVDTFERDLAEYVGTKGAVALSSGTAAIHLGLKLIGVNTGDIVFCSSFTFIGSVNPILYLGAEPVFIDSEPDSWNMSPTALRSAFSFAEKSGKLPAAVVVVDLYGQSANMNEIQSICDHYAVPILEDSAEALGAEYQQRKCGSWGKYGIFSFNGNKIITTSGGGVLVSDELEALTKARFWATQARDPAPWYQHTEMGYNYRLSNLLAAVGRGQLTVLDKRVEARRKIFSRYEKSLSKIPEITFMPEAAYGRCNRWLTVMTINPMSSIKPYHIIDALEKKNIESRPVWKPMHLQPLFKRCGYFTHDDNFSVCNNLFNTGICLPSGSSMTEDEQDRVIECIINLFRS